MERMDISHPASKSIQELQGLSGVTEEYSDKLDVRGKGYRYVPVPYRILYREADMFSCRLDVSCQHIPINLPFATAPTTRQRVYAARSILVSATPSKLMPTIGHGCRQPYMSNHVPAHSQAADPPPRTARGARDLAAPPNIARNLARATPDGRRSAVTPHSCCTPRTRQAPGHPRSPLASM
ncbi:hypothetical protein B0H11DRAFT_2035427, partial [Mycena galericulata]